MKVVKTPHTSSSREDVDMAGKDVWHVLEESATVACHRVWLLRIELS